MKKTKKTKDTKFNFFFLLIKNKLLIKYLIK